MEAADLSLAHAPTDMEVRAVALLMLQRPQEALAAAERLPHDWPRAPRLRADIDRARRELRGEFDVSGMLREAQAGCNPVDTLEGDCTPRGALSRRHADFVAPGVDMGANGARPITSSSLAPGTIVMATKAFMYCSASMDAGFDTSVDWQNRRRDYGEAARFTEAVVQEVNNRPEITEQLYSLSGGHDWPPGPSQYPGAIDVPRITSMIEASSTTTGTKLLI
jgi:hypothetical protein